MEGGGLRREQREQAGVGGRQDPLLSRTVRDSMPLGAGGATFCHFGGGGTDQRQCLLDPVFSLLIACRLGAQLLGAGSAKRGGGAAGGRGRAQSLMPAVETSRALPSGRCEAQRDGLWKASGGVGALPPPTPMYLQSREELRGPALRV